MELQEILNRVLIDEISINYDSTKFDLVKSIIERGADVNYSDHYTNTPLISAVESKNVELVQLILDYNPNVNYQDGRGVTALMQAVRTKKIDIVKLLLKHKADINLQDDNGMTALMHSFKTIHINLEINKLLIHHKNTNLSLKSRRNKTFIDYSQKKNKSVLRNYETQQYILEKEPSLYISFTNNKIGLNKKLKTQYSHITEVNELGLI